MNDAVKWEELTKEQQDEFTMGGLVEKIDWYLNEMTSAVDVKLYDEKTVNSYLNKIKYRAQ